MKMGKKEQARPSLEPGIPIQKFRKCCVVRNMPKAKPPKRRPIEYSPARLGSHVLSRRPRERLLTSSRC